MKLELDAVSKTFHSARGRVEALEPLSLEIRDREFFVLLGPSGCGKSTLLNLVAGLERPTRGTIRMDGEIVASARPPENVPPRHRNVAFVFQNYALYPHLSVYENLAFPLRVSREASKDLDRAVRDAAALLAITELLPALPGELSGGQKQRVAIARAIVRKPRVFLMDEPLSNLDARLRIQMRDEIRALQKKLGITTLYVTHDQIEAMSLGERIAVLSRGKLEQIGSPRELYRKPRNLFVAGFIGSPPMNFLSVAISGNPEAPLLSLAGHKFLPPKKWNFAERRRSPASYLFGIRPEHVHVRENEPGSDLTARIASVEEHGREKLVRLVLGSEKLTALAVSDTIEAGREVGLELEFENAHLFEKPAPPEPGT